MGFALQGVVGTQKYGDGASQNLSARFTNDGALVVAENHGRLYEQAIRGNVFYVGTAAAGAVLAGTGSGAIGDLMWNKSGGASLVLDEIYEIDVTMPLGAQVLGSFNWYYLYGGSNIGTGAPIATLVTAGSIVSSLLGGAPVKTPNIVCYVGASTWAGFAFLRVCHISCWAGAVATTSAPAYMLYEQYEGGLVMPAGMALQLNNSGGTTNVGVTATVIEVPAPGALG
jgi:hypothetical protein